jgi:hypothetical protein
MQALQPPTPTSETLELPDQPDPSLPPEPLPENLDMLFSVGLIRNTVQTAAAQRALPSPTLAGEEKPTINGDTVLTESAPPMSIPKGRATGKRKREVSPVALEKDSHSQSGPRTRRRMENGMPNGNSQVFDPSQGGRPILSCDYCPLHWHMDCLDPPMVAFPSRERRWMCPSHLEHIFVSCFNGFVMMKDLIFSRPSNPESQGRRPCPP